MQKNHYKEMHGNDCGDVKGNKSNCSVIRKQNLEEVCEVHEKWDCTKYNITLSKYKINKICSMYYIVSSNINFGNVLL